MSKSLITIANNNSNFGKASTDNLEQIRREKISKAMKSNPNAGGLRNGSGKGKKGWYKNFYCDSTYELVYIIYCLDHNIHIERCKRTYNYEYNGKIHKYHPDFELADGSLIEIKGYVTDEVNIKLKSVTDRNIKLLLFEDIKYMFDYVKNNYKYSKLEDLYE